MSRPFTVSTAAIALVSSLSLVLAAPLLAQTPTVLDLRQDQQTMMAETVLDELAQMQVVYLGETHSRAADHASQLAIIQQLHARNPNLSIGLEMIQRPFQAVLDRYIAGEISEEELRDQTEYDQRWGFPWDYYAPVFRFAQTHQIPLLALNAPTEITRRVAQAGPRGLMAGDERWVPKPDEWDTSSSGYRQLLRSIFEQHAHGNSDGFENFFLAQVLWDETMAATIAAAVRDRPEQTLVVLAGRGHIIYHYGIPSRVQRRLGTVRQRSLLFSDEPLGGESGEERPAMADYLWQPEGDSRRAE